ncbi:heterokaryon incompatibility protein-domain-containing protein [Truncatella angustata]|uniref:Heterokaryon incompatibility protein-domain-containing protein n=1 Tax=Truncatella angustata TaxID=152316 RepID=A0A9P8UFK6_9PEZI|nr:heterokaryon incompatibility protein-domain-containing protein [Truncatella angustata]KAH6649066.1 heterokaryon incompatibility protein-domain-containing protein [Truncatella angustata]
MIRPRTTPQRSYDPLSPLAAIKCPTRNNNAIIGSSRVVDLNEEPQFTALSYVWGDYSTPKDRIICNEHTLEVTRNCWSALNHIKRTLGNITIWIDAICVNQYDDIEKDQQIPLMGWIHFSVAVDAVFVWLGEATKDTDDAMDYLGQGCLPFKLLITRRVSKTLHRTVESAISRFKRYLWDAWITQLWTLREALLSDKIFLMCGTKIVPIRAVIFSLYFMNTFWTQTRLRFLEEIQQWQRLVMLWEGDFGGLELHGLHTRTLMQKLKVHRRFLKEGHILYSLTPILSTISPLLISYNVILLAKGLRKPKGSGRIYLFTKSESLIFEINERKCKYAKDRYYAALDLIQARPDAPKYTKTSRSVAYRILFIKLLKHTQDLNILLFASHAKVCGTPSWVINWNSARSSWLYTMFYHGQGVRHKNPVHAPGRGGVVWRYTGATPGSLFLCQVPIEPFDILRV